MQSYQVLHGYSLSRFCGGRYCCRRVRTNFLAPRCRILSWKHSILRPYTMSEPWNVSGATWITTSDLARRGSPATNPSSQYSRFRGLSRWTPLLLARIEIWAAPIQISRRLKEPKKCSGSCWIYFRTFLTEISLGIGSWNTDAGTPLLYI